MKKLLGIGSRVRHAEFGVGVVLNQKAKGHHITYVNYGTEVTPYDTELETLEYIDPDEDQVSLLDVEIVLGSLLQKWDGATEVVPLGDKWKGGKMVLKAGTSGLQDKEFPIETFFHKIVMLRDRLRVLEQRVNSSGMEDEEKINVQQYITRCYGSLTSFNILFKEKKQHFSGSKGEED